MRDKIKKHTPDFVRSAIHGLRGLLKGPGVDEATLKPFRFVADESDGARLNLVLPSLSARKAFGGVHTALELFVELAGRLNASGSFDLRIVADALPRDNDNVLRQYRGQIQAAHMPLDVISAQAVNAGLPTRKNDLFVTFNWWTSLNIAPLIESQLRYFEIGARPRIYLIQDYEPHFYPFSSPHLYALQAYVAPHGLYGIFNSSQLHDYFLAQNNGVNQAFVFEPKLPSGMRSFRDQLPSVEKEKIIVLYGRPNIERNCFSIVKAGLRRFATKYPSYRDWTIISAGARHGTFAIGDGRFVESVGKLSIEAYSRLLQRAAVGVSLMASPHPSYPPLEMAHFGLRTITNRYANKDLSKVHENIRSMEDVMPDTLAASLAQACGEFEANPRVGLTARPLATSYLSDVKFECMDALAAALLDLVV